MWELDYKESWALKNGCFWTVVLEKTLESPLDCKEVQPVHPKEDQSWVFIGRNDTEAETPVLWPPHAKSCLIGKDSDAGRDWGQEEKWMTEDEMVGWHHRLNGHEFEWTSGVGDGQGGLACWDSRGHKESDTTEQLNWTDAYLFIINMCVIIHVQLLKSTIRLETTYVHQLDIVTLPLQSLIDFEILHSVFLLILAERNKWCTVVDCLRNAHPKETQTVPKRKRHLMRSLSRKEGELENLSGVWEFRRWKQTAPEDRGAG